jgi:hypothetical protein
MPKRWQSEALPSFGLYVLSKAYIAIGICSAILTKQVLLKRNRHRLKQLINHKL